MGNLQMLFEIGLFIKRKNKTKQKNKTKTKQKPEKKISQLDWVWAIPVPTSTTKDIICCSNDHIYHFLDYITLLLFANANVIHHVGERGAFIGENAKGTHGEIYKSHTSVISAHFVDQVQIFFFLTHCIVVKVRLETNC